MKNRTIEMDGAHATIPTTQIPTTQIPATRWRWGLAGIFVLALCLRLYAVTQFPAPVATDALEYNHLATQLSQGNGYVGMTGQLTAFRTPGYPTFVALIYRLAGPQAQNVYLAQAVVGSLTAVLVAVLGSFALSARTSLVAGLLTAIYPGFIWMSRTLVSETLVLPFLLGTLICAATWTRSYRLHWLVAAGFLLGLGILVRGSSLLVAACSLLFLAFWLHRQSVPKPSFAALLALLAAMLIVVVPWGIRNYQLFGRFTLATEEGTALYHSYWPPTKEGKRMWGDVDPSDPVSVAASQQAGLNEADFSYILRQKTLQMLAQNPTRYFRLLPEKFAFLLVPFDWEFFPHAKGQSRSINWGYLLLIAPALLGLWRLKTQRQPMAWLLWVIPCAVFLQTLLFYGGPRFRLPAETTLFLLAAVGLCWLWDKYIVKKSEPQTLNAMT